MEYYLKTKANNETLLRPTGILRNRLNRDASHRLCECDLSSDTTAQLMKEKDEGIRGESTLNHTSNPPTESSCSPLLNYGRICSESPTGGTLKLISTVRVNASPSEGASTKRLHRVRFDAAQKMEKEDYGISGKSTLNHASNPSTESIRSPVLKYELTCSDSSDRTLRLVSTVLVNASTSEGASAKRLHQVREDANVIPPQHIQCKSSFCSTGTNTSTSFKSKLAYKLSPPENCDLAKCKSSDVSSTLSIPLEQQSQILGNPLTRTFDNFLGDIIGHKSSASHSIMTVPHPSEGKNEGTRNATHDEKRGTDYIREGNVRREEMGAVVGNQHSNMTDIGSVATCASIEEAYDIMNRLMVYKSDDDKENQPNATNIGPRGESLDKERGGITSDERIDNETVSILKPSCRDLSSISEDLQQLNLVGRADNHDTPWLFISQSVASEPYSIESGYQTFDNSNLQEEERMKIGENTTVENDFECLKSGYIRIVFND